MNYDSATSELDHRYQAAYDTRRVFENQWTLTMAMGLGHQWIGVDGSGRIFGMNTSADDRVMLTDNRMRPAGRTNIARLSKSDPMWQGIPKDRSDAEIQRARVRGDVFEHYWRELEAGRRYRLALWYREFTGNAFIKTVWDSTKGTAARYVAIKGQGVLHDGYGPVTADRIRPALAKLTPQQQAEVLPLLEDRDVTFGDVVSTLKTPFEVVVDPLATDEGLVTAEYLCEEAIYSPAYLRTHFKKGDGAEFEFTEDASPVAGAIEGRFPGMNTYLERSRERRGAAGRRGVKVREYWSLPGVDGPEGKHCVWTVAGTLLLEEANPYPFLPYTHFAGLPAGRFWADAPQNDLISPQVERNKVKSQVADNAERFGNPARLRSRDSMPLDDGDWQGLPGEEILYTDTGTPGAVPQFLVPPTMPQYVIDQIAENERSIGAIAGQNEVVQGTVPDGVTAASAIAQLMEANDTMLGPDVADMAVSLLDWGKKLLWCVRRFAKDDRLAKIAGQDSQWDVIEFSGEALGDADGDAVVIASTVASSIAAKQAGIQWIVNTMIQNGQAPPPRELRRILRDYEVGGLEHLFASINKTQAQCVEEHRRMMAGELLVINTYDDDAIHLEEHYDFMRGPRYSTLPPQIKFIFEQHCDFHRQRMQAAANNAAAAAMIQADPGGEPTLDPQALAGGQPPAALPSPAAQPSLNGATA